MKTLRNLFKYVDQDLLIIQSPEQCFALELFPTKDTHMCSVAEVPKKYHNLLQNLVSRCYCWKDVNFIWVCSKARLYR